MTRTPMLSYKKTLSLTFLAILMVVIACFVHAQTAWGETPSTNATTPTQATAIESARTAKVPAAIPVPIDSGTTGNGFIVPMAASSTTEAVSTPDLNTFVAQMNDGTWIAAITLLSLIAIGAGAGAVIVLRQWKRAQQPAPVTDSE